MHALGERAKVKANHGPLQPPDRVAHKWRRRFGRASVHATRRSGHKQQARTARRWARDFTQRSPGAAGLVFSVDASLTRLGAAYSIKQATPGGALVLASGEAVRHAGNEV